MLSSATPCQTPRRAHSRLRLGVAAHLLTFEGRLKVRLIDLSQGGARVILGEAADVRQGVLTWFDFEAYGGVVWREGKVLGLGFDAPLPLAVLIETREWAPSVVREEALLTQQAAMEWVNGNYSAGVER